MIFRNRFIFGNADEVAEEICSYRKLLGTNNFITSCQWPGMPHNLVMENIEIFAKEVMPKVRQGLRRLRDKYGLFIRGQYRANETICKRDSKSL